MHNLVKIRQLEDDTALLEWNFAKTSQENRQIKEKHKAALRYRCFVRRVKFINSYRRFYSMA